MSTQVVAGPAGAGTGGWPTTGSSAAGGGAGPGAPADRGRTAIAERAVEKIAGYALTEVGEAGGVSRRWLGVPVGRAGGVAAPRVDARIDGGLATLSMTVSVRYPAPVRQVTRRVREHVAGRVGALTGLDVRQVDVDVETLVHAEPSLGRTR